jgi:hypothetical protein
MKKIAAQARHVAVTAQLNSMANKRSKFWLCPRFVFVLQDLPQMNGCPI